MKRLIVETNIPLEFIDDAAIESDSDLSDEADEEFDLTTKRLPANTE